MVETAYITNKRQLLNIILMIINRNRADNVSEIVIFRSNRSIGILRKISLLLTNPNHDDIVVSPDPDVRWWGQIQRKHQFWQQNRLVRVFVNAEWDESRNCSNMGLSPETSLSLIFRLPAMRINSNIIILIIQIWFITVKGYRWSS